MTNEPNTLKTFSNEHLQRAFGRNLQRLRKKQGLTQEEMAEKIGRSVDMVSGLERGVTFAGFDTLTRIASIMGCSLEELFTFDPEAKPRKRNEIDDIIELLEDKPPALRKAALAQLKVLLSYAENSQPKTGEPAKK